MSNSERPSSVRTANADRHYPASHAHRVSQERDPPSAEAGKCSATASISATARRDRERYSSMPRPGPIIDRRMTGDSAFVFPSPLDPGRPLYDELPLWYAIRKEAGIEDVRLHDLAAHICQPCRHAGNAASRSRKTPRSLEDDHDSSLRPHRRPGNRSRRRADRRDDFRFARDDAHRLMEQPRSLQDTAIGSTQRGSSWAALLTSGLTASRAPKVRRSGRRLPPSS